MFTLGIPDRQKRRAVGYLKQNWIDFEEHPSMEGFIELRFPETDYETFKNITLKLKRQGVTTIGADTQLTERKIMKLADLIKESSAPLSSGEFNILNALKRILVEWETKQYPDDKTRWEEYFMDIQELVEDVEENAMLDRDTSVNEQKLRKLIRDEFKKLSLKI